MQKSFLLLLFIIVSFVACDKDQGISELSEINSELEVESRSTCNEVIQLEAFCNVPFSLTHRSIPRSTGLTVNWGDGTILSYPYIADPLGIKPPPSHTYTEGGVFDILVIAHGAGKNGEDILVCFEITVGCLNGGGGGPEGCEEPFLTPFVVGCHVMVRPLGIGDPEDFEDYIGYTYTIEWNDPVGGSGNATSYTGDDPYFWHQYQSPGEYYIIVVITDENGVFVDQQCYFIEHEGCPNMADCIEIESSNCVVEIPFPDSNAGATVNISYGDGHSKSGIEYSQQSIFYVYDSSGEYGAYLEIFDADGNILRRQHYCITTNCEGRPRCCVDVTETSTWDDTKGCCKSSIRLRNTTDCNVTFKIVPNGVVGFLFAGQTLNFTNTNCNEEEPQLIVDPEGDCPQVFNLGCPEK